MSAVQAVRRCGWFLFVFLIWLRVASSDRGGDWCGFVLDSCQSGGPEDFLVDVAIARWAGSYITN